MTFFAFAKITLRPDKLRTIYIFFFFLLFLFMNHSSCERLFVCMWISDVAISILIVTQNSHSYIRNDYNFYVIQTHNDRTEHISLCIQSKSRKKTKIVKKNKIDDFFSLSLHSRKTTSNHMIRRKQRMMKRKKLRKAKKKPTYQWNYYQALKIDDRRPIDS